MDVIDLPEPGFESDVSVEEAISNRRSIREYNEEPLTLEEVSQLLWSAQGITDKDGKRSAPSAGGSYPLELIVVVGYVKDLPAGAYRYDPENHQLVQTIEGDLRRELSRAALGQDQVEDAAIDIVFSAVYERTAVKYGDRAERYINFDVGHAAENVYLQCVSLNLGTVAMGAFDDDDVKQLLKMEEDEDPLYIMPIGRI